MLMKDVQAIWPIGYIASIDLFCLEYVIMLLSVEIGIGYELYVQTFVYGNRKA